MMYDNAYNNENKLDSIGTIIITFDIFVCVLNRLYNLSFTIVYLFKCNMQTGR